MLFNSVAFLIFLPVVLAAYWGLFRRDLRSQNLLLLAASWLFYAWWDPRFLGLLILMSASAMALGLAIERSTGRARKGWLALGIVMLLGVLGFFKYFNFFARGLHNILETLHLGADLPTVHVLLPVGISFFTFQSLGYLIDVYRGQLRARRDPTTFLSFVAFFPQLVAGPIHRGRELLPQFERPRTLSREAALDGLRQMLWGLFKKVVIADTCAPLADSIFAADAATTGGITLFFGALFFAFQIYGDFSGYSDIAIGCARLFGFGLTRNFAYPYFARSIPEFWRRWHISLSTWFRDYLYMPLGGWRTRAGRLRNILITFGVSGLWHGANWTFIWWGVLHGAYYTPHVLADESAERTPPVLRDLPRILATFLLVTVAWVFFRAPSVPHALNHLRYMVTNALLHPGAALVWLLRPEPVLVVVMLLAEWRSRNEEHALTLLPRALAWRWCIYVALAALVVLELDLHAPRPFIYFRF